MTELSVFKLHPFGIILLTTVLLHKGHIWLLLPNPHQVIR